MQQASTRSRTSVARYRWDPARGGHVQFGTLGRQLRAQSTDTPSDIVSTGAYGVNVSGKLPLPYREKRDQLLFQYNAGHGIGRYVSDLRSLGGSDAVFDETANTLRPLNVSAGFVGLEHWWARRFRSSASYGFVDVQNLDIQPDDALHLTQAVVGQLHVVADPEARSGHRVPLGHQAEQERRSRFRGADTVRQHVQVLSAERGGVTVACRAFSVASALPSFRLCLP